MIIKAQGYDILIEKDSLSNAGEYLDLNRRVIIVTDDGVPGKYAQAVLAFCGGGSFIKTVPQGEGSKSFGTLQDILKAMTEAGLTRSDCAVAVGGGVVGDLTGFAASIYMRGIDFYNIPTTMLSQIDSSVGGKTAINFLGLKNIIGAFYRPKKVMIDENTLSTLTLRQINNGLAESVKMATTSDPELFDLFENGNPYDVPGTVIEKSLRIKNEVVSKDEKEKGLRRVLNFGHTIGHGIEANCEGKLYHGECVAIGMLPMCSDSLRARLSAVLEKYNLPTSCDINAAKISEAVLHDKKSNGDSITAVCADEPGKFRFISMKPDDFREKINSITENRK